MRTLKYKQTLFQYIIQYALNHKKTQIHKLPKPDDFTDYLQFSLLIHQTVFDTIYCPIKIRAYQAIYAFVTHQDLCCHMKFDLYKNALDNPFFDNNEYIQLFNHYFYLCQKTYHNLIKFANICKIKIKKSRNQFDLQDNIINIHNSLPLIHNNELYCFSKSDIIKLFYNSLINSNYDYNNDPTRVKNPYTNIHFKLNHLYNMYFYIKQNPISNIHPIINGFYNCNFNIHNFVINFDNDMAKLNIKRFVNNGDHDHIYKHIRKMIFSFNDEIAKKHGLSQITLFKHFPIKAYIDVFKPYLINYLTHAAVSCTSRGFHHWCLFKNKIIRFAKNSETFGRIIVTRHKPKYEFSCEKKNTGYIKIIIKLAVYHILSIISIIIKIKPIH